MKRTDLNLTGSMVFRSKREIRMKMKESKEYRCDLCKNYFYSENPPAVLLCPRCATWVPIHTLPPSFLGAGVWSREHLGPGEGPEGFRRRGPYLSLPAETGSKPPPQIRKKSAEEIIDIIAVRFGLPKTMEEDAKYYAKVLGEIKKRPKPDPAEVSEEILIGAAAALYALRRAGDTTGIPEICSVLDLEGYGIDLFRYYSLLASTLGVAYRLRDPYRSAIEAIKTMNEIPTRIRIVAMAVLRAAKATKKSEAAPSQNPKILAVGAIALASSMMGAPIVQSDLQRVYSVSTNTIRTIKAQLWQLVQGIFWNSD